MARSPAASNGRATGGFTFVELLLTLAILAFAFTYAVIHLDGATGPTRLASAARQVGSSIEFLRGQAIQAARPLEMEIDIDNGRFRTIVPPRPSETDSDHRDQEELVQTEWTDLPRRVRFQEILFGRHDTERSGIVTVQFSPMGEIAPNGFLLRLVSDEIADPDEAYFSLEINGLTGEVAYLPGMGEFEQVIDGASFR
jgi:prepilin-type N-terminal cleavage/methylation domain-containing protein